MVWYQIFRNGPEYEARALKATFEPPDVSIRDLHRAVPRHLFLRSTATSLLYIVRHIFVTILLHLVASRAHTLLELFPQSHFVAFFARNILTHVVMWLTFWGWQGMAFAGIWCLGHEAGHHSLSPNSFINDFLGIFLHTFVLTPYYAWRTTHRNHHKGTNHMDRDETYVPFTRKSFALPNSKIAVRMDYTEVLEDTPLYTLFKLFIRQFFGFQLYLLHNRKGNPKYSRWTSHYNPRSLLFRAEQYWQIIASDIFVVSMFSLLGLYGRAFGWLALVKFYFMPWLFAHNWLVMITYLQHSDPTVPYYRAEQWTFARGALATVDRPLFGWVGRFFLLNITSDHIAHHFFSGVPFYNLPAVTEAIKPVLGAYYNYDSTGVICALWRSFTQCVFVEDEGSIVFFKNRYGEAAVTMYTGAS
ncbi:hypothetical protein FISHEDRAFT_53632 [Fistulina hepatica ATCC 64428]|nr:hypothetical protein FISHEDRAFT_53632 [Fistulina hepatica ATCC 64428]